MAEPPPIGSLNGEDDAEMGKESGNEHSSVDSELEYRKEMEEQRIEDRKNGHFSGSSEEEDGSSDEEDGSSDEIFEACQEDMEDIDPNLEYHMEMEDQRLTYEKNGHFVEEFGFDPHCHNTRRPVLPKSREGWVAAAKYVARVSDVMNLDAKDEEGGKREDVATVSHNANSILEGDHRINCADLEVAENGGSMAVRRGEEGLTYHTNAAPDLVGFGSCDNYGKNNTDRTFANIQNLNLEAAPFMTATTHALLQPFAEVNTRVYGESEHSVLGSGDNFGDAVLEDIARFDADNSQGKLTKNSNAVPIECGTDASPTHAIDVPPISAYYAEVAADMDLLEAQPLRQHQIQFSSTFGPPPSGQLALQMGNKMQPTPPTGPTSQVSHSDAFPYKPNNLFNQNNPKPLLPPFPNTFRPNSHPHQPLISNRLTSAQSNQTATQISLLIQPTSQINQTKPNTILPPLPNTTRSNSNPKPPLHFSRPSSAQINPKSKGNQRNNKIKNSSPISNDIALTLFGNHMHEPSNPTPAQTNQFENYLSTTMESSAFPPLRPMSGTAMATKGAAQPLSTPLMEHTPIIDVTGKEDEECDDQPKETLTEEARQRNRAAQAKGKNVNCPAMTAPSTSWADIVEKEHGVENTNGATHMVGDGMEGENHPKVFFGCSMADVLRTGQPTEGPILLDHARAQKRGEVRMIEGKPCLFFSSDESTDLAGRIGPAIVGKFSHSIPTAHQIQKALGNLKLVGTLSWNFLNAKHVFIQLSEMSDYVKILNGPNNSPVWYIEHHPMRVFKWTPEFDPFFEIPIVALWCNILALPVHLFEESALIAIGNLLGHAVQVDRATITRSRVSFARICVEVDISQPIPEDVSLDIAGKRVTLKVKWDKMPLYCGECRHVGHIADNCYAFGRRPMPPKKDYSHGAPGKSGSSYQWKGDQPPVRQERGDQHRESTEVRGHEGQPRGGHATGDHRIVFPQVQSFGGQLQGRQILETQQRERQQVQRPDVRILQKESDHQELGLKAKGYLFHAGPSGTAMEGTHEAENDGFLMPKKKKKTRSAASRARKRERRRQRKQQNSTSAAVESEGGGDPGSDGQDSSSEGERGTGSLSPSYRPRHVDGPLAMVAVNNNMFGALEDFPSDNEEGRHVPGILDTRMVEASDSRTRLLEFEDHGTGHTSPPSEGRLKKARLGASGTH